MYFLKTIKEKSDIRLLPIAGQTLADGTEVDATLKVSGSKALREAYPVGTIFICETLKLASTGKNYASSSVSVFNGKDAELCKKYKYLTGDDFVVSGRTETIFEKISLDKSLICPSSKTDGFYMSTGDWKLLVRNIKKHVNTLIVGPTGSGKTSCIKEVCNRLGLKLHIFDMGSMIDPISSLLGVHRLEGGKSIFDYANFTQVIQEPCVILLDELNRASLACNNVLFPCLDDRRKLTVEVAGKHDVREINVHPEVTFIATANIGAEYSGTTAMDRALVNRFFPLELNVIPRDEEEQVLITRTGIKPDESSLIVKIANNIRSLARKQEISMSLSIRETLMVAELVVDGWDLGKAMEMVYLPLFEGNNSEGERATVYKTISSY